MVKGLRIATILLVLCIFGCDGIPNPFGLKEENGTVKPERLPDVEVETIFPSFANQKNEVEIADSFNDMDPTVVLGSIVDVKTGEVWVMDNYLKEKTRPLLKLSPQVVYRNFIDNSLVMKAQWLDFLQTGFNDSIRAEITVTKNSNVNILTKDLNQEKIQLYASQLSDQQIKRYQIIIGYTDYLLSAALFKDSSISGSASGYGAKIGGKWYNKHENTAASHRLVATCGPLRFIQNYTKNTLGIDEKPINLFIQKYTEVDQYKATPALKLKMKK